VSVAALNGARGSYSSAAFYAAVSPLLFDSSLFRVVKDEGIYFILEIETVHDIALVAANEA
jgi:hypothetical protein